MSVMHASSPEATSTNAALQREHASLRVWLGSCLFLSVAMFFLWTEHRALILGVIPYLLLLFCLIIHLLVHGSHRGSHEPKHSGDNTDATASR